jgi:hypothetical protein
MSIKDQIRGLSSIKRVLEKDLLRETKEDVRQEISFEIAALDWAIKTLHKVSALVEALGWLKEL